jgi:hypothetical protein
VRRKLDVLTRRARDVPAVDKHVDQVDPRRHRTRHLADGHRDHRVERARLAPGFKQRDGRKVVGGRVAVTLERRDLGIRRRDSRAVANVGERAGDADHVVEQRAHVPLRARCRVRELVGTDAGDDLAGRRDGLFEKRDNVHEKRLLA